MSEQSLRQQICLVGKDLWERGLVGGAEGNVSARLDDDKVLSTPSGAIKGKLEAKDICLISADGESLDGKQPSSEIKLHLRIYKERPDVNAVVHAHPPVATGFALAGETFLRNMLPEADLVLGPVAMVPFAIPGSYEMGDVIAPLLQNHQAFLLASHGAATVGKDLNEAYMRIETLERIAKVFLVARLLGGAMPLPPEGVRWLSEF